MAPAGSAPTPGLYDSRFEHDACGVGFIADLTGRPGHDVVSKALTALCNLEHRGAEGGDPGTGDGAGILTQIPDAFFREVCDFDLPPAGSYVAGLVFLPATSADRGEEPDHERDEAAGPGRTSRRRRSPSWPRPRTSSSSAGATCRTTRRSAAAVRAPRRRTWCSCSWPAWAGSAASSWSGWRSACASGPAGRSACISRACRRGPSSTRGCCPRLRCRRSSLTCPMSGTARRWPWCTPGFPPTRSRPGSSRTRTGTSRTTARSTRSAATGTGCGPARRCWPAACCPTPPTGAASTGSSRCSTRTAATRPVSTSAWSCCTWAAGRCRTRC